MNNQTLINIAKQYGTPIYVYDEQKIIQKTTQLKTEIGLYPNSEFLYAIKANPNPHLAKIIIDQGFGIDSVSLNEAKLALKLGCPLNKIMYTENNMSDDEMDEAKSLGILINFNSIQRLEKFGAKYPGSKVCLRFNPNIGAASHSTNITGGANCKFGISFRSIKKVQNVTQKYNLKVIGIHQHIGSGWLHTKEPIIALQVLLDIAKKFENLEFVDFGGGFGIPYGPHEKQLNTAKLGIKFNQLMSQFNKNYYGADSEKQIKLRFEPGRFPIAEAGTLLTKVTTVKKTPYDKTFVGTDTGMNHLVRPAMYDSYHPITNLSNPHGKEFKKYDVVGNICESADFFAKDRILPRVQPDNYLAIEIAGAYGTSMSNLYHLRSIPAEYLIKSNQSITQIRKAQSLDELLSYYNYQF